uniref:Secreted protein n=1 Tax=Trichogramma kaykai TaxID=54128 RepID=A0ABD2WCC4_9HYME
MLFTAAAAVVASETNVKTRELGELCYARADVGHWPYSTAREKIVQGCMCTVYIQEEMKKKKGVKLVAEQHCYNSYARRALKDKPPCWRETVRSCAAIHVLYAKLA